MKAETADYLLKARATLADAEKIAAVPLPHVGAREAYYAVYHAAEAYIFEQTGKVATTHRGVRSEFGRLARRNPGIDRELTRFLATAYQLKVTADYGIGPTAVSIRRPSHGRDHDSTPLHRYHHPIAAARLEAATGPERPALAPCINSIRSSLAAENVSII
jgi:uncharacterized protein (UPF0332 family)